MLYDGTLSGRMPRHDVLGLAMFHGLEHCWKGAQPHDLAAPPSDEHFQLESIIAALMMQTIMQCRINQPFRTGAPALLLMKSAAPGTAACDMSKLRSTCQHANAGLLHCMLQHSPTSQAQHKCVHTLTELGNTGWQIAAEDRPYEMTRPLIYVAQVLPPRSGASAASSV